MTTPKTNCEHGHHGYCGFCETKHAKRCERGVKTEETTR